MRTVTTEELKRLIAENCMLKIDPQEIDEEKPLFGPEGLGLDSIDALQLVVAIEKQYNLQIKDPELARKVMVSLKTLQDWIANHP